MKNIITTVLLLSFALTGLTMPAFGAAQPPVPSMPREECINYLITFESDRAEAARALQPVPDEYLGAAIQALRTVWGSRNMFFNEKTIILRTLLRLPPQYFANFNRIRGLFSHPMHDVSSLRRILSGLAALPEAKFISVTNFFGALFQTMGNFSMSIDISLRILNTVSWMDTQELSRRLQDILALITPRAADIRQFVPRRRQSGVVSDLIEALFNLNTSAERTALINAVIEESRLTPSGDLQALRGVSRTLTNPESIYTAPAQASQNPLENAPYYGSNEAVMNISPENYFSYLQNQCASLNISRPNDIIAYITGQMKSLGLDEETWKMVTAQLARLTKPSDRECLALTAAVIEHPYWIPRALSAEEIQERWRRWAMMFKSAACSNTDMVHDPVSGRSETRIRQVCNPTLFLVASLGTHDLMRQEPLEPGAIFYLDAAFAASDIVPSNETAREKYNRRQQANQMTRLMFLSKTALMDVVRKHPGDMGALAEELRDQVMAPFAQSASWQDREYVEKRIQAILEAHAPEIAMISGAPVPSSASMPAPSAAQPARSPQSADPATFTAQAIAALLARPDAKTKGAEDLYADLRDALTGRFGSAANAGLLQDAQEQLQQAYWSEIGITREELREEMLKFLARQNPSDERAYHGWANGLFSRYKTSLSSQQFRELTNQCWQEHQSRNAQMS